MIHSSDYLSLSLCCHSSPTPLLQFLSITVSSLLPSCLQHQQEENKFKKEQRREQCKKRQRENIKGQGERRAKQSHPFLIKAGTKTFFSFFVVLQHDNPAQATTVVGSFATPKFIQEPRILVVSHHTWHGCFHHHLIRQ